MMVTLDPDTDIATVGELLREMAHATRTMPPRPETATMIGSLASGLDALREVLDQLAIWHERAADGAVDPTMDGDGGYRTAFDVALQLSRAAMQVEQAATAVEAAHHAASRISWPAADQDPGRVLAVRSDRRLAPPSLFGVAGTHHDPVGISPS